MTRREGPELFVGLIGAAGSPLGGATQAVIDSLGRFNYSTTEIRLSRLLKLTPEGRQIDASTEAKRIETSMRAGTALRQRLNRGDALIAIAAAMINGFRRASAGESTLGTPRPLTNSCFVLNSIKHEDEIDQLRKLYRDQFICIGVYSPRWRRVRDLSEQLAHSAGCRAQEMRSDAERLIAVDEKEPGTDLGQGVGKAFPLADAFVSTERLRWDIDRVFELLFGNPFLTPSRDEQGIFLAQAAAMRSGALGRQVGACVTNQDGDVLAIGCNEVPRAGGGQYWAGDAPDGRDLAVGHDRNDLLKQRIVRDMLRLFKESDWLEDQIRSKPLDDLLAAVISRRAPDGVLAKAPRMRDSLIAGITEFGRDVHAEMSALMTMARLGIQAKGCTLYCTTFPCHNCAKHIIASGVLRAVYIEPYPKSFAAEFHPDALVIDGSSSGVGPERLTLEPFSGVAPRKYLAWFRAGKRKTDGGKSEPWSPTEAFPIFAFNEFGGYAQADLDLEATFIGEVLAEAISSGDTEQESR